MYKNILQLDDGTQIEANAAGSTIKSLVYTTTVSGDTDIIPGAACSAKIEFVVWVQPGDALVFTSGTRIRYYQQDDTGARQLIGTFWAVKPTKQKRNSYKVYAYDAISRLDGIQSTWLRSIQDSFPMSLWTFAQAVAQQCGATIANDALPNSGDYQVQAFYADNLTGRQLLSWVAQAACTFLRATPAGAVEFAWYAENAITGIYPDATEHWAALNLSGMILTCADGSVWTYNQHTAAYRSGGLSYEDYTTAPIVKVQLKQTDDDVGVIYPPDETGTNALVIQGNLLLTTDSAEALRPVAQAIFEGVQRISYTPLKASLFSDGRAFAAGQIITATDPQGNALQTYVMTVQQQGGQISVESTGNSSRDSTAAVNQFDIKNLSGKVLELSVNIDGLRITAKDLEGQYTELSQTVDSITLTAENDGNTSKLILSANGIQLSSANITFSGMVTFEDLAAEGGTTINGGNITTGTIGSEGGNTVYDLDAGTIRTGRSNSNRVQINDRGITWYVENAGQSYLTGVLYSKYGATYIGDNSRYTFLGWFSNGTPDFGWSSGGPHSDFVGIAIDQTGATIHCNANKFEIPGRIECSSLAVNGREI